MQALTPLLDEVRSCRICEDFLVDGVRPVLQVHRDARVLVVGQAPGRKVHESGVPFDDASGERLRDWMGVSREAFYDERKTAILPMGFCFPGTGKSGDLPPRQECAEHWRTRLLEQLVNVQLTVVIGMYAIKWHLSPNQKTLTEVVRDWECYAPTHFPIPHPSPRNNIWLKKNPWFEQDLVLELRSRVATALP